MEDKKESQINYDEWWQKIHGASNPKIPKEDKNSQGVTKQTDLAQKSPFSGKTFSVCAIVFFIALIPRLLYLFIFSNPNVPGWYTDVFHHWQVAYLSKEIGFSHGFLRLWDFKGMEFFWGLLHPLVLSILFTITGSVSILVPRLLSTFAASISIVFLFILIRKYFNNQTAWAVCLLVSFFPLAIFSNTAGMQEELGMMLILGSLCLWTKNPIIGGVLLALSSMVRSEYWLFSAGLVFSNLIFSKEKLDKRVFLAVSYCGVILIYMKYLLTYTNNAIYPVYWNFLASVKGEWFEDLPVIGEKLLAKHISQGIFAFGLIGGLITLLKRPRYMLLYLFGFANIVFIGFMVGFGSYVKGYIPRFWVDRLYNWPYLFTMILFIVVLFYFIPKKISFFNKLKINWLIFLILMAAIQLVWQPIDYFMKPAINMSSSEKEAASKIATAYKGGVILMPEDRAQITYFLANDYKIEGKNMQGQMFDPFFYFKDKDKPFSNWKKDRKKVIDWLKKENIKLIALTSPKPTYMGLIEREPQLFEKISDSNNLIMLYRVNEIPNE